MSEHSEEIEVESPSGYAVLPKDITDEIGTIKLFNKWSYEDVEIRDISLTYGSFPLRIERTHWSSLLRY
jgi:hypothetical protein